MAGQGIDCPGGPRRFALVAGPTEIDQPLYSFEVSDEILYHNPNEFANALLALPGVRRTGSADRLSGEWSARWKDGDRYLDFDLTCMEPEDGWQVWRGPNLEGRCTASDLLQIWSELSEHFDGVWLHGPDCRLYEAQMR